MDDNFEVIENDFKNTRWDEDLKVLNAKGLNNRNLLLNLLGELGNAENVFNYLRTSPKKEPRRAVEQEESPEGFPLISPNDSPVPILDYFAKEKKQSDFSPLLEANPIPDYNLEQKIEEEEEVEGHMGEVLKEMGSPKSETLPLFRPPVFQLNGSNQDRHSADSDDLHLTPSVKRFNSISLSDMSASMMLSSPLQELVKPSEPVIPLDLNGSMSPEESSETPSLPIHLSICANSEINILPNPENSLIPVHKPFPPVTTGMDIMEQNFKNQSEMSAKSLWKAREHRHLRSYLHFTDIFLAMILTTFVWWTCKEIYRLCETLSECEKIVQNINSTVNTTSPRYQIGSPIEFFNDFKPNYGDRAFLDL